MISQIINNSTARMSAAVDDVRQKLAGIRTGRAAAGLLDRIVVDAYGSQMPLNQLANVSVPESSVLLVQPWDASMIAAIERAILSSDLGVTPSNDGKVVRIPIPALNEERRKQLAKVVRDTAEEHRAGLRNIRHSSNDEIKKLLKDKEISEDEEKDALAKIQKQIDEHTQKINDLAKQKEEEILKV